MMDGDGLFSHLHFTQHNDDIKAQHKTKRIHNAACITENREYARVAKGLCTRELAIRLNEIPLEYVVVCRPWEAETSSVNQQNLY